MYEDSPSDSSPDNYRMDRSSNKKHVMFEDQPKGHKQEAVKRDLFNKSDKYASSKKQESQGYGSESDQASIKKHRKPDYDHFHDESMSKLEAVLQRQRERLENLGGFSGKSSQISQGGNENEQNLEEAYKDLEKEINNIKRNLEASQNSDGTSGYSPAKIGDRYMRGSHDQEDMSLSPSDLADD